MTPETEALVEHATQLARAGGWSGAGVEHLFLAMLDDDLGRSILTQAGARIDDLRTQIGWILRGAPKRDLDAAQWLSAIEALDLQARRGDLTVGLLLSHLMATRTAVTKILAEQGVSRVDVLNVVVHGTSRTTSIPSARVVRGAGEHRADKHVRYRVVFHNDQFTSIEFVCDVLDRHVGMRQATARSFATEVDHMGVASLGPYKLKHALKLIELVTREAHAAGFPLKLSCEPIPG